MLGSGFDAEDAVQETMVRAWRAGEGFEGRSSVRSWLYRIATNVCLDMLRGRQRRARPMELGPSRPPVESSLDAVLPEGSWISPIADERVLPPEADPAEVALARDSIRLAFIAMLQHLPARQRAALILCEVLRWQAAETAELLDTSVAAVNSALQRARATMQSHLPGTRAEWSAGEPTAGERELVEQFIAAHERLDAEAAMAIAARDLRVTMPPLPHCYQGAGTIRPLMGEAVAMGEWRLIPVGANRMPAAASYLRRPGDSVFRAFKFDVMRIEAGMIAEITTFNADLFPAFGLELRL